LSFKKQQGVEKMKVFVKLFNLLFKKRHQELTMNESYLVLIAAGGGIDPVISIINQSLMENPNKGLVLLYYDKDKEFLYKDELIAMAELSANFSYSLFSSKIALHKEIYDIVELKMNPQFYITGPVSIVKNIKRNIRYLGVSKKRIIYLPLWAL
jgi:ferredoxin-NADP reductase